MEYRKLSDLKKLLNNPRRLGKREFADLCQSLRDNPGFFEARPLILSDRTGELVIIAGNMKAEAAKANGLTEVPTILLPGLTEAQEREITVRDNAHAGDWDWSALANEWSDLPLADWGVPLPAEWGQAPDENASGEDESGRLRESWEVLVSCSDESSQRQLLDHLTAEGYTCRAMII